MMSQDIFVGIVAIGIGGAFLAGAAWNTDAFYNFWMARWIQQRWGRGSARLFYVVLGATLILLGLAIASGWRMVNPSPQTARHAASVGDYGANC